MSLLTELLGNDDAIWMSNPDNNCAPPAGSTPKEIAQKSDLWFPTETGESRFARRLCGGCPSKAECLEYAIPDPTLEGIWGGLTTRERAKLRSNGAAA